MSTIVIMPGGFHPFHAGHYALYQSAKKAFPGAEVYVAATNDMSERPFPFSLKEKLAKLAGVEADHFVQVKNPFQSKEITQNYNPDQDVLIFVRSEKDRNEQPKPGGTKKDGTPAYFQSYTGKDLQPFSKHAYMAYLPTVEFGPGITSATQIRNAWPTLNDKRKTAMVMSLYPAAQQNPKLAQTVVGMFDQVMGGQEGVAEGTDSSGWIGNPAKWKEAVLQAHGPDVVFKNYSHPGQPGKRSVHAWDANGKIVGVYQRHNKMGMVQPNMQGVAEGAPIVVMPRADRLKKAEPTKVRYQGDIVPSTQPPSTEKRGVKGRPGQRPMPKNVEEEKQPSFMKPGNMKPFTVSGEEKPGAVEMLEKALVKAKERGIKLNYDNIDKMMQLVCSNYNLTGDELHDKFVEKHNMIPDDWIKKKNLSEDNERCMQCGMTNCSCTPGKCGCKPIAGWIPNKGFKKAVEEAANTAQQAAIAIAKKKKKIAESNIPESSDYLEEK